MKFKLPWSYWLKKQRKDKPPRPILATEVTYEEELIVEIALRVLMKNTPDTEDVGDLLSSLARENFRLNKVVNQVANYAECLEDELDSLIPLAKNKHNP